MPKLVHCREGSFVEEFKIGDYEFTLIDEETRSIETGAIILPVN